MFSHRSPLLKSGLLFLLITLIWGQSLSVQAQTSVSTLENMVVDIWPDYDRPSVLVIFTGILPASASLPATITIPIPDAADLTAVARINETNDLLADIDYDESVEGEVTLTTPDPRFRVEYYMPYELDGEERTFTFSWQSEMAVSEMRVSVQQPVDTTELTTEPAVFSVLPREDGFQYHNLSPQTVAAGEKVVLTVRYSRPVGTLSADLLQPETTTNEITSSDPADSTQGSGLNLTTIVLISGGVAILAVGVWMLFGERKTAVQSTVSQKAPAAARPAKKAAPAIQSEPELELETADATTPAHSYAKFCHQCGQKTEPGDSFCRSCGTRLRN